MKTTAATALFLSAAVARMIDGASLATSRGENVKRQTSDEVVLQDYDYVIVGSGAGGSPLAARLAQGGYSVLLLEAGDDQTSAPQYKVPLLHPAAVEHAPMRWDFFVKHYDNETENMRDEKLTYTLPDGTRYTGANPPAGAKPLGILYPRAGTLGGCTSHNALITVYPHDSDWQYIQNITGDATWAPDNMRKYFQRLEHANPDYVARGAPGHGFDGWLQVSNNNATAALQDPGIVGNLNAAMAVSGDDGSYPDANRMGGGRDSAEGLTLIPVAMKQPQFERSGPVDLLRDTMNAVNADGSRKYKLDIQTNTLVTTLRFAPVSTISTKPRISGVNFLVGRSLYKADPLYKSTNTAKTGHVTAKREVIVSAGTFNTPQILKLSGIGPKDELTKWNITTVVNLPGVGKNMQDRYEAPVITRSKVPLTLTAPCTFLNGTDPCYDQWQGPTPKGPYATNGGVAGYIKKSPWAANNDSDLFISMFPGAYFNGYYPDNVYNITHGADAWTWLPLKAHSRNNAGTVTLTSNDPRDVPDIRFRYFSVGGDEDLNALVDGLKWGRKVMQSIAPSAGTFTEVWPGPSVQTDDEWRTYAKYTAWGHHASCTSPIGAAADPNAVLDTNFKVRGVDGLRVVDASAFPKIPGFYIVTPTYMMSEKAADVILAGK